MEPDDALLTALRRGVVEFCVLGLLAGGERYGLEIAKALSQGGILMNGEGTLYPLLARLRRQNVVETHWRESAAGPPRRYYALTDAGRTALAGFRSTWDVFRDTVDGLLDGNAEAAR